MHGTTFHEKTTTTTTTVLWVLTWSEMRKQLHARLTKKTRYQKFVTPVNM